MRKIVRTSPDAPCNDCGLRPKHKAGRCKPCRNDYEKKRRNGLLPKTLQALNVCNDCQKQTRHRKKSLCKDCYNRRERVRYDAIPFEIRSRIQLNRFYRNAENNLAINRKNMKKWRDEHPEASKAQFKAYRESNPEKFRAYSHKRRALQIGAEGHFTDKDWSEIVHRQQSCCMSCGKFCDLTMDHIVPLSRLGSNWPSNLQGLCKSCNSSKNAALDYQFIVP